MRHEDERLLRLKRNREARVLNSCSRVCDSISVKMTIENDIQGEFRDRENVRKKKMDAALRRNEEKIGECYMRCREWGLNNNKTKRLLTLIVTLT